VLVCGKGRPGFLNRFFSVLVQWLCEPCPLNGPRHICFQQGGLLKGLNRDRFMMSFLRVYFVSDVSCRVPARLPSSLRMSAPKSTEVIWTTVKKPNPSQAPLFGR
jgi:hypothetical protein